MIHIFLIPILYLLIIALILYSGKYLLSGEAINGQDISGQCMLILIEQSIDQIICDLSIFIRGCNLYHPSVNVFSNIEKVIHKEVA